MTEFCITLAGIPIVVKSIFDFTKTFCKDYLTEELPLVSVEVCQTDIDNMRENDRLTAIAEGRKPVKHSGRYLETLALAKVVLEKLIDYNVLMFHGAVVAKDNKAYLFAAKSGTGKTTHCKLWLKNIPDCHILNGDKPLLLLKDGKIFACGSPWMGKEKYGANEILPLEAICLLERGDKNRIDKLPFAEAFTALVNQIHRPDNKLALVHAIQLVGQLNRIKTYRLKCNMEDEAALVSYRGMVKE